MVIWWNTKNVLLKRIFIVIIELYQNNGIRSRIVKNLKNVIFIKHKFIWWYLRQINGYYSRIRMEKIRKYLIYNIIEFMSTCMTCTVGCRMTCMSVVLYSCTHNNITNKTHTVRRHLWLYILLENLWIIKYLFTFYKPCMHDNGWF